MTERIGYKLNPKKLVGAPQGILPYVVGAFYYTEDFEYFDVIKPYLDIPEEPKSLEEISQELDEKFEKLIEQYKRNSYSSKICAERNYENKFDKIFDNFEYAKEHGKFPQSLIFDYSKFVATGSSLESSFVIKQGSNHKGYYTMGNQRYFRYYMPDKPTAIVRFFMRTCLGFFWVDEKDG
jgi:hypothetical protein